MKRSIKFITAIVLILAICFSSISVFAVSFSEHYDYSTSTTNTAYGHIKVRACCSNGSPSAYVRVRVTKKPVLSTSTDTTFTYGPAKEGALSLTSSVKIDTNYVIKGTAHACYSKCPYCGSATGNGKSSYHHVAR